MKEEKNITQGIKKGIVKAILWVFLILFFSMSVIVLSMQSPTVQTRVAQWGSEYLSKKLGFNITIDRVNIEWFDQFSLNGLHVKNKDQSTFIEVRSMLVDYNIKQLITVNNILFDEVKLDSGRVMLIREKGDDYFNIDYLVQALRNLSNPRTDSLPRNPKNLLIKHVQLSEITLGVANLNRDTLTDGFNYNQFVLLNLNADVDDFSSKRDTLQMQINHLTALDSVSNMYLKDVQADFEISQSRLSLTDLYLQVNKSILSDSIVFNYNSISNLSYITDSVNIAANFKNSEIYAADLALFAPYLDRYQEKINLSGKFNGKVKNFTATDLNLSFGDDSFISGRLKMDGLPNFSEAFIDMKLTSSKLLPQDLEQYINDSTFNRRMKSIGITNFSGSFIGFPSDFVANGVFISPLGRVESDLNLKITPDSRNSTYQGSLSTYNFNLGKFLEDDSLFQKVQMTGTINGKGFSLATAQLNLNATINLLGIYGYEYQNIRTNAELASEFFNGNLSINDPALKLTLEGSIDLRNNKNLINVRADLDTINFKDIKLTQEDFIFKAAGQLNGSGIILDSIQGDAFLQNVFASYKGNELELDTLSVSTFRQFGFRALNINSDLFSANVNGSYNFTELQKDIPKIVTEYRLNLENNEEALNKYYANLDTSTIKNEYQVNFSLATKKLNPLINFFMPELHIKPGAKIDGVFSNGRNSSIYIEADIDSIHFKENIAMDIEIDLNFSKDHLSREIIGMGVVESSQQKFSNGLLTDDLFAELIWTGQEIDFKTSLLQTEYNSKVDLSGNLEFIKDSIRLKILKSNILALEKNWNFPDENELLYSRGDFVFSNFGIISNHESIIANGELSRDTANSLSIRIDSFNIENINNIVADREFKGDVNGFVRIDNFENNYLYSSEISINAFHLDNFLIGDIRGYSDWQPSESKMEMDYIVNRKGTEIITIFGNYTPGLRENSLNLSAELNNANLLIAEPFLNTIFSDLRGMVDGNFNITGNLNYPIITGIGNVSGGALKVNYLNTNYNFDGNILFDQDKISFDNIQLRDTEGNTGQLYGDLLHNAFTDLELDLVGDMNSLQVLNTTAKDNSLYYGTAFVSGRVMFFGKASNMTIEAEAKSERGTRLFIPVESTSTVEREDYIHFINIKDTAQNQNQFVNKVGTVDITGINLNFDLEITPDAYAEIIFDIKSGDIIRGRGNGKISLNIDTNGAFSMLGDYTLTEGGYNFTLYNIINKEFLIQPGSRITWDGNPYGGILDIDAIYQQNVSLMPIINVEADSSLMNSPELKRRYPAKVLLELKGDLLQPEVDFDIEFSGYPDNIIPESGQPYPLRTAVTSFNAEMQADEQELKRQVFSLIILRRLSPRQSFAVSGSVGNSVSEFLSNQLSYWVTQIDENLEIDVDFGSFDQDQFNTFQLRLSYSFLDGRLRVTRDGGFTQGETDNVNQEILGILGDWSVEYLLTPDGKLRAKIYNRTNFNTLDRINNTASTSTGVSLVHVTSFNQIREIFNQEKQKVDEQEKIDEQQKQEDGQEILDSLNSEAIIRKEVEAEDGDSQKE